MTTMNKMKTKELKKEIQEFLDGLAFKGTRISGEFYGIKVRSNSLCDDSVVIDSLRFDMEDALNYLYLKIRYKLKEESNMDKKTIDYGAHKVNIQDVIINVEDNILTLEMGGQSVYIPLDKPFRLDVRGLSELLEGKRIISLDMYLGMICNSLL